MALDGLRACRFHAWGAWQWGGLAEPISHNQQQLTGGSTARHPWQPACFLPVRWDKRRRGTSAMPNVLLVDDNVTFARFLRVLVESKLPGVQVMTATGVAAARALATTRSLDIALLDVRLPDGNGLHLHAEMKALYPQMRFVLISAEPLEASRLRDDPTVVGVLIKPFASEALVRLLRKALAELVGEGSPPSSRRSLHQPEDSSGPWPGAMKHQLMVLLNGLFEIRQDLRSGRVSEAHVHRVVDEKLVPLISVVSCMSRQLPGRGDTKT